MQSSTPAILTTAVILALGAFGCGRQGPSPDGAPQPQLDLTAPAPDTDTAGEQRTAVIAGGCFWCTEAVFEQLKGVSAVVSGYAGGTAETANYEAVSGSASDHAEAIRITYVPGQVSYGQLLKVFFTVAHDPTQKDRQGPDRGRQYRSVVFYSSEEQKNVVAAYVRQLEKASTWSRPIVTTLEPLDQFYPAEDYHQDFVKHHPNHGYVVVNALPKVKKVREKFAQWVREPG